MTAPNREKCITSCSSVARWSVDETRDRGRREPGRQQVRRDTWHRAAAWPPGTAALARWGSACAAAGSASSKWHAVTVADASGSAWDSRRGTAQMWHSGSVARRARTLNHAARGALPARNTRPATCGSGQWAVGSGGASGPRARTTADGPGMPPTQMESSLSSLHLARARSITVSSVWRRRTAVLDASIAPARRRARCRPHPHLRVH